MRRISIRVRIILLIVLAGVISSAVGVSYHLILNHSAEYSATFAEERLLRREEDKLRVATHAMAVSIGAALKSIPDQEARTAFIRAAIDGVRFEEDSSGYFFVYRKTTNVALPVKKELQGKDLADTKDSGGVYFVRELARKAEAGGGFVRYVFAKPGQGDAPKLAYSELIPGTDFWIGTGVYVDNLERMAAEQRNALLTESNKLEGLAMAGASSLFLLVALPLSWLIFRSVAAPLSAVTEKARRVAEGDLDETLSPSGSDEITQLETSLAAMVASLKTKIDEAAERGRAAQLAADEAGAAAARAQAAEKRASEASREGASRAAAAISSVVEAVDAASRQLGAHVERSGAGAAVQTQRGEETATAVREMNATVLEVARNAASASENAAQAKSNALDGARVVEQAATAIDRASQEALELTQVMSALHRRADAIGNILGVISDIADQTNLLALNAAIEAARAGDAGRGFAVVADEVRKLAEKTVSATKEVGQAVKAIQDDVQASGGQVEKAASAAREAAELAARSGDSLRGIVRVAEDSADQIRAIATAAEEQSAASEQITRSVEEVAVIARSAQESMQASLTELTRLGEQVGALKRVLRELES